MSSAGQKKRDQRNEKYYPGAFAFAWLANVASTSDGGDRSIETEQGIGGAGETTAGSPPDSWMLEERMNRTEASVRDTSQAGGSSAARAQEAPGADDGRFGFGALTRDTNKRTSMAKTRVGATGLGCFVPGQDDFNEHDCKKASDQWRHDLEMRLL